VRPGFLFQLLLGLCLQSLQRVQLAVVYQANLSR
jgi:hypothetical protein